MVSFAGGRINAPETPALRSGALLRRFETLDSTSLEARRLIDQGQTGPLWVLADRQTAGYGRRGSVWRQAVGDLAATYVEPLAPTSSQDAGQASFLAALALYDAVAIAAPSAPILLKWPNDVLLDNAKASGVLLEMVKSADGRRDILTIGIGVNIVSKPDNVDHKTARLADYCSGPPPGAVDFLRLLDAALTSWLALWRREGFTPVRKAWMAHAAGLDQHIRVKLPNKTLTGVFRGMNAEGALILECTSGLVEIAAGAVFFEDAADD